MDAMVSLKNISKSYGAKGNKNDVLKNIDLEVKRGEFLAVLGASGSGKTTLLNIIGGLDEPDSGEIYLDGQKYASGSDREMAKFRRENLGFIFQSFHLIPVLTVYENIIFPLQIGRQTVEREQVMRLMEQLGIDGKKDAMPGELSGGQQQRTAIARAMITHPKLILADEPTGNLDSQTGRDVLDLLKKGVKENNQTLILITHNAEFAQEADTVVQIRDGRVQG